jgi:hypothetical protein
VCELGAHQILDINSMPLGGLAKATPLDDMKKKLGHKLPKIWDAFKTQANDPTLARFDDVISTLINLKSSDIPTPILGERSPDST